MKKILFAVKAFLNIKAFAVQDGKKILTAEQKTALETAFSAEYITKLMQALENDETAASDTDTTTDTDTETEAISNTAVGVLATQLVTLNSQLTALNADKTALAAEKLDLSNRISGLSALVEKLSSDDENKPPATKGKEGEQTVDATNDKFLMGIQESFMSIDATRPYNKRAYAAIMARQGIEVSVPMATAMDYSTLKTDLGDFYRVKYNDRIQSFLKELPSIFDIFPLQSGYQNQAVLINLFLNNEFSQADNTSQSSFDNVLKGGYKFEDEIITMYDVMFAFKFTSLKDLERTWIGNMNKEGSQVIKWSFVEYILTETAKKLHNEQMQRFINGKRVNPTANVAGASMGAADGLRQFIKNQIALFKMKAFSMVNYGFANGDWDNTNAVSYIKTMVSMIPQVIRDTGMLEANVPYDFKVAYNQNYRSLYAINIEDSVATDYIQDYSNVKMVVTPNLSPSRMIVFTLHGNISTFENVPGEMTMFNLEQQDWGLKVWSNWKESIWAFMVGQKMTDANSFPDDFSSQMIWVNDVDLNLTTYTVMDKDTAIPSVASAKALVSSVNNTALQTITNITGGVTGDEIRLKCGTATLGIKVLNAGNFILTADWVPAKGDILCLKQRSDGKFFEINRMTAATQAVAFAANATAPDVTGATTFVTVANGGATALTTLTNAVTGKVYTIYGGSATNSTTIANAGNFVLTAAMTLGVGNMIQLIKSVSDSKFYEISRV